MYDNAGVLRTVNVNWNDGCWNVNANSVENPNRWNDGNQVFSRNYYLSSAPVAEVFFCKPFLHPPSCLPISSKSLDIFVYFSVGISLASQASCIKNFRLSSFAIVLESMSIFCSVVRYTDANVSSNTSKNDCSIFCPIPNLSTLGKSRCRVIQNL